MQRIILLFFIGISITLNAQDEHAKSVVKIFSIKQGYDYFQPWQKQEQKKSSGSGCILAGDMILTNAHVVANATFIEVRKSGEAKKYTAEVKYIAHDYDLAILKVKDQNFFDETKPVKIGGVPNVRDKVAIYGFPKGGDKLSITEGIVSRIEYKTYAHSLTPHLLIQTDASINPGNSGGPVLMDGVMVGVAFQGISFSQNIGYFIPTTLINHFLKDIKDGTFDGLPAGGFEFQKMENETLNEYYGLSNGESGVRITNVANEKSLLPDDISLQVDGQNVERDGTYEFRPGERVFLGNLIQQKAIGDKITYEIIREGKRMTVEGALQSAKVATTRLVSAIEYDAQPEYKMVGGMVFMPLTRNYYSKFGRYKPKGIEHEVYSARKTKNRKQAVVLTKVLPDECNVGFHGVTAKIISEINGEKVVDFYDFIDKVDNAKGKYLIIKSMGGHKYIFERELLKNREQIIIDKYGINQVMNVHRK